MATKIRVLEPDVVAQIAAGEVVERPASVVKELVENSLDAGARKITVEVEAGGKRLIRVSDDGCGMSPEDAVLAFQRHATSKIRTADDLHRITTLGFRGEALPSIAAVSRVELLTREHGSDVGTKVVVEEGVIVELSSVGCPVGTIVSVHKLFHNVPARLKFLRSATSEFNQIADLLTRFILARPNVSFTLRHDGRDIIHHSVEATGGDLRSTVAIVWGSEVAKELVPVELSTPKVRILGLTSKPSLTKSSRSYQVIIVNGRCVRHHGISLAISYAYRGMIPSDRHPVCVVCIEVEPSLVDVNVHPAKIEVKFENEAEVQRLIIEAIQLTLVKVVVSPGMALKPPASVDVHVQKRRGQKQDAFGRLLRARLFSPSDSTATKPAQIPQGAAMQAAQPSHTHDSSPQKGTQPMEQIEMGLQTDISCDANLLIAALRPIAQLHRSYILAEAQDGLYIISQHRAHERIIYESLCERATDRHAIQWLITPMTLSLGQAEAKFVEEHLEVFRSIGVEIEPFGGNAFVVRSIPAVMLNQPYAQLLHDIVAELMLEQRPRTLEELADELRASIACKSAIKAGEALSMHEMERLIADLCKTSKPLLCPHGQPVMLALTTEELNRRFER
ncbi:MAG: DNA mismatch repair endonuclease MutL [Armatimonadota bacterium]|nr:DNA mismatch repair endonuclease MutL [Armatimonadota bacterium]MCX7778177.1 DNA mismatch repair endonuclease MutL [Armatimonadota bacterium]MDW8025654.1 DNA mismatch repair endonuclease MutL [Armatimonadota bacterium]